MATEADIGYGGSVEVETSPDVWFELGEVTNVTPPNETVDVIDATHMASPNRYREFIQGLIDAGEGSIEVNWVAGGATDDYVFAWRAAGETRDMRITTNNNTTYTFPSFVTGWAPQMPVDGKMAATLTVKAAGAITVGTAA
jgi:predicted secreted protein